METKKITSTGKEKYVPPTFEEYEFCTEGILCTSGMGQGGETTDPNEGEEGGAMRDRYNYWPGRNDVWE